MIKSFSTETKSGQIAKKIEEMILNKEFEIGESLPSQQEMSEMFNASSRSIREAVKQLEAKGLVKVQQGKRATVETDSLDQFVASLSSSLISAHTTDKKLLMDFMQVRTTIEVSAARELSRSDDRSLRVKALDTLTNKMEQLLPRIQAGEQEARMQWNSFDFDFHMKLIESNDNRILSAIYDNLAPMLYQSMAEIENSYEEIEKSTREHRYLVDALEHGQTDLAVALALVHLTEIGRKLEAI